MTWQAQLQLRYRFAYDRTDLHFVHDGPLRVLQSLYPEGAALCQSVLVHPPGGLVAGDLLNIDVHLEAGAQALVTTPGATRFYRRAAGSSEPAATQRARVHVGAGARLEWLPLESIAYPDCQAINNLEFHLDAGAEMMGWDCLALGLPAAQQYFDATGCTSQFDQRLAWPGVWLERGRFDAADTALLNGPIGLDGQRAMVSMWWAKADGFSVQQRQTALDTARAVLDKHAVRAGSTSPNTRLIVVRALAEMVEPLMHACMDVRSAWVREGWQRSGEAPRIWSM